MNEEEKLNYLRRELSNLLDSACSYISQVGREAKRVESLKMVISMKRDKARKSRQECVQTIQKQLLELNKQMELELNQELRARDSLLCETRKNLMDHIRSTAEHCSRIESLLEVGNEQALAASGDDILSQMKQILRVDPDSAIMGLTHLDFVTNVHEVMSRLMDPDVLGYLQCTSISPSALQLKLGNGSNRLILGNDTVLTITVDQSDQESIKKYLRVSLLLPDRRMADLKIDGPVDGVYTVCFTPRERGMHSVHIRLYGTHVCGSPMPVIVHSRSEEVTHETTSESDINELPWPTQRVRICRNTLDAVSKHIESNPNVPSHRSLGDIEISSPRHHLAKDIHVQPTKDVASQSKDKKRLFNDTISMTNKRDDSDSRPVPERPSSHPHITHPLVAKDIHFSKDGHAEKDIQDVHVVKDISSLKKEPRKRMFHDEVVKEGIAKEVGGSADFICKSPDKEVSTNLEILNKSGSDEQQSSTLDARSPSQHTYPLLTGRGSGVPSRADLSDNWRSKQTSQDSGSIGMKKPGVSITSYRPPMLACKLERSFSAPAETQNHKSSGDDWENEMVSCDTMTDVSSKPLASVCAPKKASELAEIKTEKLKESGKFSSSSPAHPPVPQNTPISGHTSNEPKFAPMNTNEKLSHEANSTASTRKTVEPAKDVPVSNGFNRGCASDIKKEDPKPTESNPTRHGTQNDFFKRTQIKKEPCDAVIVSGKGSDNFNSESKRIHENNNHSAGIVLAKTSLTKPSFTHNPSPICTVTLHSKSQDHEEIWEFDDNNNENAKNLVPPGNFPVAKDVNKHEPKKDSQVSEATNACKNKTSTDVKSTVPAASKANLENNFTPKMIKQVSDLCVTVHPNDKKTVVAKTVLVASPPHSQKEKPGAKSPLSGKENTTPNIVHGQRQAFLSAKPTDHITTNLHQNRGVLRMHVTSQFGKKGTGIKEMLKFPIGVTVSKQKSVIVCDNGNSLVKVFDWDGTHRFSIGDLAGKTFVRPSAVVATETEIFVKDDKQIQAFDINRGTFLRAFGKGILSRPYGLALSDAGHLVTIDENRRMPKVVLFAQDGTVVNESAFEPLLHDATRRAKCRFLTIYRNNLYVVDLGQSVVYMTNLNGKTLNVFGGFGDRPGQFREPSGITADSFGNLLIADSRNNRIQLFGPDGHVKSVVQLDCDIIRPSDIHLTDDGHLLVVNYLLHCVKVYSV